MSKLKHATSPVIACTHLEPTPTPPPTLFHPHPPTPSKSLNNVIHKYMEKKKKILHPKNWFYPAKNTIITLFFAFTPSP